ncbi:MAG: hypothetical protein M3220_10245, partial [Chloroflexota bacterium]|nr:hypothetical protein [Chloroflexota bacterium]
LIEAMERNMPDQLAVRREDFDDLRAVVLDLVEAQQRTEQRVEELVQAQQRTEQPVDQSAQSQQRTEAPLDRVDAILAELVEAEKRTEQRLEQLIQALTQLIAQQTAMQIRLDRLVGDSLERRYREWAYAYFGRRMRRVRVVGVQEIEAELEGHLSDDEMQDLSLIDVLVRGHLRQQPEAPEVWLALEVSAVVDRLDVERAQRRTALLKKAGYLAIPMVAGEEATARSREMARMNHVLVVQNGQQQYWDEALATALAG